MLLMNNQFKRLINVKINDGVIFIYTKIPNFIFLKFHTKKEMDINSFSNHSLQMSLVFRILKLDNNSFNLYRSIELQNCLEDGEETNKFAEKL